MKIAIVQMSITEGAPATNVQRFAELAEDAVSAVDVIVGPELMTTGYVDDYEILHNEIFQAREQLRQRSQEWQSMVIYGTAIRQNGKWYNAVEIHDGKHGKSWMYYKVHLFPPFG